MSADPGVWLDADLNEQMAITGRQPRAETVGLPPLPAIVSRMTPGAFQIGLSDGGLTIGAGRMHVDGLLAENHGSEPIEYGRQPHWPSPAPLPGSGQHLAYLDVWERVPDPVGAGTGTQIVWQVRLLAIAGGSRGGEWDDLVAPSAARLTTGTGYRGPHNQLYRVELHSPAHFKWSRDNASVGSVVAAVNSATSLRLRSLGRDGAPCVKDGDARLALVNLPGSVTDCRPVHRPVVGGKSCGCEICVTPDQHNAGTLTIQDAIERASRLAGATITLSPGTYRLDKPLELTRVRSIRIRGCGQASRLVGRQTAIKVTLSQDIALEDFSVNGGSIALDNANRSVRLERLWISQPRQAAIGLTGAQELLAIRECLISAHTGVRGHGLYTSGLAIEDNTFVCTSRGIDLGTERGDALQHAGPTTIRGNTII